MTRAEMLARADVFRQFLASGAPYTPGGIAIDGANNAQLSKEFSVCRNSIARIRAEFGQFSEAGRPEEGLSDAQIARRTAEILARAPKHRQELLRSAHAMWEAEK